MADKKIWRTLRHKAHGVLEFYLFYLWPGYRQSWGGPFNGQESRRRLVDELFGRISFSAVIETGTFRGTTTEYFRTLSNVPVFTVELHPRYYGYVRARFAFRRRISVCHSDSRVFLARMLKDSQAIRNKPIFFYLDAHWYGRPPLRDELQIIFGNFASAVVMIDDFKVPDDDEYAYDKYEDGHEFTMEYIAPVPNLGGASVFFPAVTAAAETGMKRGCVVLARQDSLADQLKEVKSLRFYTAF